MELEVNPASLRTAFAMQVQSRSMLLQSISGFCLWTEQLIYKLPNWPCGGSSNLFRSTPVIDLLITTCSAKIPELNYKLWPRTQSKSRPWSSALSVLWTSNLTHFPSLVGALHFSFTVLQVRWSDKALFLNFGFCVHSFQLYSGVLLSIVSIPLWKTPSFPLFHLHCENHCNFFYVLWSIFSSLYKEVA